MDFLNNKNQWTQKGIQKILGERNLWPVRGVKFKGTARLKPFFATLTPLFLLHWHPAGGLTRLRISYCSKKHLYNLTSQGEIQLQAMYEIRYAGRNQLFIYHLLYITSQSVPSYVCMSLPYVFFTMCIFLRVYIHTCAYSIPRSIWTDIPLAPAPS